MKFKIIAAFCVLAAISGVTALADPLGWFSKPPLEYVGNDFHDRVEYRVAVWDDGSVEAIVTPKVDLPEEQRPAVGEIRVNDKAYRFAKRKNQEGKDTLYASLPVGAIPIHGDFTLSIVVEDSTGHRLVETSTEQDVEE